MKLCADSLWLLRWGKKRPLYSTETIRKVPQGQGPTQLSLQFMAENLREFSGLARLHTKLLLVWFKEAKAHPSRITCAVLSMCYCLWRLERYKSEGVVGSSSIVSRATEAKQCVIGLESPQDHERTLHRTVTVKPGLQWRCQDVEDTRAVRHLSKMLRVGMETS